MADNFTPVTPTEFTPYSGVKFIGLAESNEKKKQEYYEQLLAKKLQYEESLASKSPPTINPLTEEEGSKLATWQNDNEQFNTLLDSVRRNNDAWFDTYSTSGKVANKILGFGTRAITDIGLNVAKAPAAISNIALRSQIDPEVYAKAKAIDDKNTQGIPLSQEDTDFIGTDPQYVKAKQLLSNERMIASIDQVGEEIQSVVNTLPTDMAVHRLNETNQKALAQFKEGETFPALATFLSGIYDLAVDDTDAALQFTVDSLPYMISLIVVPQAAIPVLALDINEGAVRAFQEEYNRMPNGAEQTIAVTASVLSAALDKLGAQVTIGGTSAVRNLLKLSKATNIPIPKSITKSLAMGVTKVTGRVGESLVTEGITEGGQNVLEQFAGKQDVSKIDPIPVMTEAQIGAASGGVLSSVGSARQAIQTGKEVKSVIDTKAFVSAIDEFKASPVGAVYTEVPPNENSIDNLKTVLADPESKKQNIVEATAVLKETEKNEPEKAPNAKINLALALLKNTDSNILDPKIKSTIESLAGIDPVVDGDNLITRLTDKVNEAKTVITTEAAKKGITLTEDITEESKTELAGKKLLATVHSAIASLVNSPDKNTPENAELILETINTSKTDLKVNKETINFLINITKLEADKKSSVLAPITESPKQKVTRGEKQSKPETVIEGVIEMSNSKLDTKVKLQNLLKMRAALAEMIEETGQMKDGSKKRFKMGLIDKYTDRYIQLANFETNENKGGSDKGKTTNEPKPIVTSNLSKEINKEFDPEDKVGTTRILNSILTSPNVPLEYVRNFQKNFKKGSKEHSQLENYFIARNIPEVGLQVVDGGGRGKFSRGTNQYRKLMSAAVNTGDKVAAQALLTDLSNWHVTHSTKTDIKTEALFETNRQEHEHIKSVLTDLQAVYKSTFDTGFVIPESKTKDVKPVKPIKVVQESEVGSPPPELVNPEQFRALEKAKVANKATAQAKEAKEKEKIEPTKETKEVKPVEKVVVTEAPKKVNPKIKPKPYPAKPTPDKPLNLDPFEKSLEKAFKTELLSEGDQANIQKALDTIQKVKKGELPDTVAVSVKVRDFTELVTKKVGEKTADQLRNKILTNSIRIKSGGDVTNAPKTLSAIVKAKTGKPKNIFQKIPNLFGDLKKNLGIDYNSLTEAQKETLKIAEEFYQKFSNAINSSTSITKYINPSQLGEKFKNGPWAKDLNDDAVNYFIQEVKGKRMLDPNLVAIISTISLDWIATMGQGTLFNTNEAIQRMLGLSPDLDPTSEHAAALRNVGVLSTSVKESLGTQIFNMLELESANPEFEYMIPKLKMALGQIAVVAMEEFEDIIRNKRNIDELLDKEITEDTETQKKSQDTSFIQVAPIPIQEKNYIRLEPEERIERIINAVDLSDNILNTLLDIERTETDPSFKPIVYKKGEVKISGTPQLASDYTVDVMNKEGSDPWGMAYSSDVIMQFDDEYIEQMVGIESTEGMHKTKAEQVDAKNRGYRKEIKQFKKFKQKLTDKPDRSFFFRSEGWSTGRLGMIRDSVTPLFSKIHRHLVVKKAWRTEAVPGDYDTLAMFKMAVAQSLGIKSTEINPSETEAKLQDLLTNRLIIDAVRALQRLDNPKIAPEKKKEYQKAVVMGVNVGKENLHSFQGLVELAKASKSVYRGAKIIRLEIDKKFTTYLPIEIDGKTNGIAFSLLQSGIDGYGNVSGNLRSLLNSVGIFTGDITNSIEWSNQIQNLDIYKNISRATQMLLSQPNKKWKNKSQIVEAIQFFKDLSLEEGLVTDVGRKFSKSPVLMFNFSAGNKSIKQFVSDDIIQVIYDVHAELVESKDSARLAQLNNAMSVLLESEYRFDPKQEDALTFEFTKQQAAQIKKYIDMTYGAAITRALRDTFKGIARYRNALNNAAGLMYFAFIKEYDQRVEDKRGKLGGRDLSTKERYEILDTLEEILPAFKGPYSKTIKDSILALNIDRGRNYTKGNTQQMFFGHTLAGTKSTVNTVAHIDFNSPGIKALILNIHHLDSAVQQKIMDKYSGLNVHDAFFGSIKDAVERGKDYNMEFWMVNQKYHGLESMYNRLVEILDHKDVKKHLTAMNYEMKKATEATKKRRTFSPFNPNPDPNIPPVEFQSVNEVVEDIYSELQNSKAGREQLFKEIHSIDNYVIPDGEFQPGSISRESEYNKAIDSMFSSPTAKDIDPESFDSNNTLFEGDITPTNSQLIFNDLSKHGNKVDPTDHTQTLQGILSGVINRVITPASKLSLKLKEEGSVTHGKIIGKNIYIVSNHSMGNSISNVRMSAQETYVHELLHAISQIGLDANRGVRRQINKLFELAKAHIKSEDFLTYTTNANGDRIVSYQINEDIENEAALAQWKYIFENPKGHNLDEFVAYGLSNEVVMRKLSEITVKQVNKSEINTVLEKLQYYWRVLLDYLTDKFYQIQGDTVDQALLKLVQRLNDVKNTNYSLIFNSRTKIMDKLDAAAVKTINAFIFKPMNKLIGIKPIDPKTGERIRTVLGEEPVSAVDAFGSVMQQVSRNIGLTERNFLVKLAREVFVGQNRFNKVWREQLRKSKKVIDQARNTARTETEKFIKKAYLTKLTKEESVALSRVLIKTDLSAAFTKYGLNEEADILGYTKDQILDFLEDPTKLKKEIKIIQDKLLKEYNTQDATYFINQVNNLGHFMATGMSPLNEQNNNVHNIVRGYGVDHRKLHQIKDLDGLEKQLDILATLFGLNYTHQHNKTAVAQKIKLEFAANPKENGITTSLGYHKYLKEQSLDLLFFGNKELMTKGYFPDIVDPNIGVAIGTEEMKEEMAKKGYVRRPNDKPVFKDSSITGLPPMYLYITKERPMLERVRTTVSLTSQKKAGTGVRDMYSNAGDKIPGVMARRIVKGIHTKNQTKLDEQFTKLAGDLSKIKRNYMVPVRNEQGGTVDYRYMMTHDMKQTVLAQDEQIERVMGVFDSSIVDKHNSKIVNTDVVDIAYKDYQDNFENDPEAYVEISIDSPIKEYKEIYKLLPDDMRRAISDIWGEDKMMVRAEMVDLIFGFRKASLLNLVVFNQEIGKMVNDGLLRLNKILEVYAPKIKYTGTLPLKALEDKVQDVVRIVKDIIVVKTGEVLLQNIISNTLVLMAKGVPITKIFKLQFEGYREIEEYHKTMSEIEQLKRRLASEKLSDSVQKRLTSQVNKLTIDLKTNPVHPLVDEGIFQSIVEDIEVNKDTYDTSSKIAKFAEDWADKHLHKHVVTAAKFGWIDKESTLYKTLFKLTQYGDFVSRYALYKHRVSEVGLNKLTPKTPEYKNAYDKVIDEVIETFINYDIPTSPEMQYLNDMGVFMFTKFLFRIQRIIFKTFKERPASAISVLTLRSLLGGVDLSYITDSILGLDILKRFSSPVETSLQIIQVPLPNMGTGL